MNGRKKRRGAKVLTVVLSVVVALVATELVARLFLPLTDSPVRQRFRIDRRDRRPYVMFGSPPYSGDTPVSPKPEGELRIVMLGGSTVEHGDPPIAGHLERELKDSGVPAARVYNYGVVSSVSSQELVRLLVDLVDLEPDVVIMYNGANDIIEPFLGDPRPGYPFDFVVFENNPLLDDRVSEYPAIALLLYESALLRRLMPGYFTRAFTDVDRLREEVGVGTEPWMARWVDNYVGNLIKARKVSNAFGARFIGAFQPVVYYKEPRSPSEEAMIDPFEKWVHLSRRLVREGLDAARARGDLDEKSGLDLSDAFDGIEESVFYNSVHINEPYRVVIARRLRDAVLAHLEAERAEPY